MRMGRSSIGLALPTSSPAKRGRGTARKGGGGGVACSQRSRKPKITSAVSSPPPLCGACHRAGHFGPGPLAWSPSPASRLACLHICEKMGRTSSSWNHLIETYRGAGIRRGVIPGRDRKVASPESIFTDGGYGFRPSPLRGSAGMTSFLHAHRVRPVKDVQIPLRFAGEETRLTETRQHLARERLRPYALRIVGIAHHPDACFEPFGHKRVGLAQPMLNVEA